MAHLWLQVLPKSVHDSRRLYAEAWAHHALEKYPNNYAAQLTLGLLALARFDATGAVSSLRDAVTLKPDNAIARNLYGTALAAVGRNLEAGELFKQALHFNPDFANARFNLAHVEAKSGQVAAAINDLEKVLKSYPADSAARKFLNELTERESKE